MENICSKCNAELKPKKEKVEKKYNCEKCYDEFNSIQILRKHHKTCFGVFNCIECNKQFDINTSLASLYKHSNNCKVLLRNLLLSVDDYLLPNDSDEEDDEIEYK